MNSRLAVAVSCGEPAGIGPEIAAKAAQHFGSSLPFFVIGDPSHFQGAGTAVNVITHPDEAHDACADGLAILPQEFKAPVIAGQPTPENAQGVIDAIARGVDLVGKGQASALCTLPIHKKALIDGANFAYPGHTEYLAQLAGVERVVMMLACDALRVVPTTIHIALKDVASQLDQATLRDTIRITAADLHRDFGLPAPRIAVAGLNPHAGEGGVMGREEIEVIAPVIEEMRSEGYDISGPHSADTMFHAAARQSYDVAICMYHDQALIPIKTIDFAGGVNVTLGLPFIRTSPDHGTGFDIAGQGKADPTSFIAALTMARQMAQTRAATS